MQQGLALLRQLRAFVARPAVRRGLRLGFWLVSLLAWAYVLAVGVGRVNWAALNIDWRYIALAGLMTVATVLVGVLAWAQLGQALLPAIPAAQHAHMHTRSLLAKHLPGGVWNSASKVVLLHQAGIPAKLASLVVILEPILLLLTGLEALLVMVALSPEATAVLSRWSALVFPLHAVIIVTTMMFMIFPALVVRLLKRNQVAFNHSELKHVVLKLWFAELLYVLGWFCLCACFCLLVSAIQPLDMRGIGIASIATVMSFLISLVAIVIPNGIGLRELSYSIFMSKLLNATLSVSLGFMFRLLIALAEICVVMVITVTQKLHNTQKGQEKEALTPMEY
jgi:hypothetical protein